MAKWGIYRNSYSDAADPYTEVRATGVMIEHDVLKFYKVQGHNIVAAFSSREFYIIKLED